MQDSDATLALQVEQEIFYLLLNIILNYLIIGYRLICNTLRFRLAVCFIHWWHSET